MDPRIRYCVELDKIKDLPDYKRVRAEARFIFLKEYEAYVAHEAQTCGKYYSAHKATKAYCTSNRVPLSTFYNWLRAYKASGITGLVPRYGNKSIRPTLKPPHKKKREHYAISFTFDIIPSRSPLALEELGKVIAASPLIAPAAKASFVRGFKRLCDLSSQKTPLSLTLPLTKEEKHRLELYQARNHKKHSAKATAILMINDFRSMLEIGMATNTSDTTIYRWHREFNLKRLAFIETKSFSQTRADACDLRTTRIVDIIHNKPSRYGINRSSWSYGAITIAYEREYGIHISKDVVQRTVKRTGYSWRHARKVLTSPDPEYRAKVERILLTLRGLKEGERFFFIDEVGPYRVKKYGGRYLGLEGDSRTVPEIQKSKGKVQFVAALEALSNQMTWLFTDSKGSRDLVALLERLVSIYNTCTKIFMTWDAIGMHSSRMLRAWIAEHNNRRGTPTIEIIPLPANSQFLNVIEAVFCGMKRAVICNSDYSSRSEMENAIARHFEERNQYFLDNPRRAGCKIWDREKFDLDKLAGGLFRRM